MESTRANTPILSSRKRPASTPPVEVERPRKTTSMGISNLTATSNAGWLKLEGKIDDVQTQLSGVETNLDRLHNRLENVEDKMDRLIDAQERPRRRCQRSRRLAETTAKILQCQICHLFTRPPANITTCCRQWLGCQRCVERWQVTSGRRCPLCNTTWDDGPLCVTLHSLDELTELGKQVSDLVGSSLVHSDGDGAESTESELPEVLGQSSGLRRSRSAVTREPSARTEAQDSPEVID